MFTVNRRLARAHVRKEIGGKSRRRMDTSQALYVQKARSAASAIKESDIAYVTAFTRPGHSALHRAYIIYVYIYPLVIVKTALE